MSVRRVGPPGRNARLHASHELSLVPSLCGLRTHGTANCFKQSDGIFPVCVSEPSCTCEGVDSVFVLFGITGYTQNALLWRVLLAVTPLGWQLRL